ncbi:hypothetical protein C0995_016451 [Termitomyces sp. Mi166|nr:hypothetical protein C0995_016451 [Termitomyces sp. Mi166\
MDPLPENLRQLANDCVTSARRLSQICAASGRVDYDESNRLVKSWEATHEEQARAWANDFASVYAVTRDSTSITPTRPIEMQKKPVFNREYTPLLEKYFEFNAYPSAPDRAFLARKSMMSPRQIEVWFQNHRNRARKEGKCLRKLTDHSLPPELTLELSLKSLEEKMPYFTIPVSERQSIQLKEFCGSSILDDDSDLTLLGLPMLSQLYIIRMVKTHFRSRIEFIHFLLPRGSADPRLLPRYQKHQLTWVNSYLISIRNFIFGRLRRKHTALHYNPGVQAE